MGPVRVGNGASSQRQNDIYGSVILAASQMFWDSACRARAMPISITSSSHRHDRRDGRARGRCRHLGVSRPHPRPHFLGRDVLGGARIASASIADKVGEDEDGERWLKAAAELARAHSRRRLEQGGRIFQRQPRRQRTRRGAAAHAGDRHRRATTIRASARPWRRSRSILLRDGLMMRYAEADDFGMPETAFLVCTFWYIEALANCGTARRGPGAVRARACACAIMSASCPRTRCPRPANCGAISRRPIPWSASSIARGS